MLTSRTDLLRRMPVFGGLKDTALELILAASSERSVAAGDYFFRSGDRGDKLFVLERGEVIIEREWQGRMIHLGGLGVGDCFGEMAIIDFKPRSASVRAATDCVAIEIPVQCLRSLYRDDLEQYTMIMMNMGREVSRRLRLTEDRLLPLQHGTSGFPEQPDP